MISGAESADITTPVPPPTGSERILVVDDEPGVARYAGQSLSRLGYVVTIFTSSTEALSAFKSDPPAFDLIITDMTMPKMTGEELADTARKIRPDIPVILCTGYSKRISRLEENPASVDALLLKPVSRADLAKTVRRILEGRVKS